jgi:hypothetical protein
MIRIGLVSFRLDTLPRSNHSGFRVARKAQLSTILEAVNTLSITHLLLPGWTFVYSAAEIQRGLPSYDIEWLGKTFKSISIVGQFSRWGELSLEDPETSNELGYRAWDRGRLLDQVIVQQFTTSESVKEPNQWYCKVLRDFRDGQRTFKLNGLRVAVLSCGEINLLKNIQGDTMCLNRVAMRHIVDGTTLSDVQTMPYDVLFHPAHTQMGNLGKMKMRWSALSHGSHCRMALFTTNVVKAPLSKRVSYAFCNGREMGTDRLKSIVEPNGRWIVRACNP